MASDTREHFLDAAEALFAERGFYGVSIASIAGNLGLTKQALLHHFGSKEKLYGHVLQRISDEYQRQLEALAEKASDPTAQLKAFVVGLAPTSQRDADRVSLLIRELLDNKRRAESASTWYLKPFLETLTDMVHAAAAPKALDHPAAFAIAYQLLGAINYYAISGPTLEGILGEAKYQAVDELYAHQLAATIDAIFNAL